MAFDNLEKNITYLSSQDKISAEDIVYSMNRLLDDAEEYNHEHDVSEFRAQSVEKYSLELQDLLIELNRIFSFHKSELEALDDDDLREVQDESLNVQTAIKIKETLLRKLLYEQSARKKLDEEIEKLQKEIQRLENELSKRREISIDEIKQKKLDLEDTIEKQKNLESQLRTMDQQIQERQRSVKSLNDKYDELCSERRKLEEKEASLKKTVEEYRQWIGEFPTVYESYSDSIQEAANMFTAIQNAWNSAKDRADLSAIIDPSESTKLFGEDIRSFPDLNGWFYNTGYRIYVLLDKYREMYNKVLSVIGGTKE